MKGYRFYAEMDEARGSKSASKRWGAFNRNWLQWYANENGYVNCIAVLLENGQPMYQGSTMRFDVISAVNGCSNAPVCLGGADNDYLRKRCVRIDEDLARRLHPRLFSVLEEL